MSGGTIVIGDVGGAVVALDARDGSELWRHSTGGAFVYSSPAIAGGAVFIGSYDGVFRALDLAIGGAAVELRRGRPRSPGRPRSWTAWSTCRGSTRPARRRRTYGLDAVTGAVRAEIDDGRYSPAVGAGRTLYLVGTRTLRAYPAPAP